MNNQWRKIINILYTNKRLPKKLNYKSNEKTMVKTGIWIKNLLLWTQAI